MKGELPLHFANALMRAGKDFDLVPLHRRKHGPCDPAAGLDASTRIPGFYETKR
jgi:dipeptidyl aminopeptidase/acylaminoacyl peptidase